MRAARLCEIAARCVGIITADRPGGFDDAIRAGRGRGPSRCRSACPRRTTAARIALATRSRGVGCRSRATAVAAMRPMARLGAGAPCGAVAPRRAARGPATRAARTVQAQRMTRLETGDVLDPDGLAEQLVDVAQQALLDLADQRDRESLGARATGTTDAVHVILGDHRQVEVDDPRQ